MSVVETSTTRICELRDYKVCHAVVDTIEVEIPTHRVKRSKHVRKVIRDALKVGFGLINDESLVINGLHPFLLDAKHFRSEFLKQEITTEWVMLRVIHFFPMKVYQPYYKDTAVELYVYINGFGVLDTSSIKVKRTRNS